MRITGISTWVVDAGDRDWVFLRVETDEPGLAGWGKSSRGEIVDHPLETQDGSVSPPARPGIGVELVVGTG